MTRFLFSPHYRRIAQILISLILALYAGSALWMVPYLDALGLDDFDGFPVRYAIALIVVQAAVQAVLVVGLVASKQIRTARDARRAGRMRRLEDLFSRPQALLEVQAAARRWPDEFLVVVDKAMQALSGSARTSVAALLESSAGFEKLLGDCRHPDPRRAIRAISILGRTENERARAAVSKGLDHSAEAVRRAARKAIVVGGNDEARRGVLRGLSVLPFWERIILFHLAPEDATLSDFLEGAFSSDRDDLILVALEFILTRQRLMTVPVPEKLGRSLNVEVRIKFYRALPFLRTCLQDRDDHACEVLANGLRDEDWRVRAQAARSCGLLRAGALVPQLLAMCSTFENPAEAGHASRALAALGGDAWRSLQEMASVGGGAANRIAVEVIERHMIGSEAHT